MTATVGTDENATFGERLRALRLAAELSEQVVADLADVHRVYLSRVERGEVRLRPDAPVITRLARAVGVPPEVLIGPSA